MKKIIAIFMLSILGYGIYAWSFLAGEASRPVISIVTDDSYMQIPSVVAKAYLRITDYSIANGNIEGSPSIPYLATGYDLGGFRNGEILILIDRFLENGADVNAQFQNNKQISRDIHLKERPLHFFVIDFAVRLCFHFK
jgi:hypothetical protein